MRRSFLTFTRRFFFITNFVVIGIFLIACITPFLNPAQWWFAGFMSLLFPFLFILVFVFFVCWLFVDPKWSLLPLAAMVVGWKSTTVLLGWNYGSSFNLKKSQNQIRILDWNVRRFAPYYAEIFRPGPSNNEQAILAEIKYYQPDVICFQEFYSSFDPKQAANNVKLFQRETGYPYYVFSNDFHVRNTFRSGTAIFSRYPIIDSAVIRFPDQIRRGAESLVSADILFNGDTIRVYSMHLQSFGFLRRDYEDLGKIKNQQDSGLVASRSIFRKMRSAFSMRGQQADFVKQNTVSSPHPKIVCGDLNDVPNSYAYFTVKGDMKDAFLLKGKGWGKTFTSSTSRVLNYLPTLRIDFILTDASFKSIQFDRITRKLSDHMGLVADLKLEKK
jgi:endonuclease/exonuclease/phosphatase family metal-dependent hydrolase